MITLKIDDRQPTEPVAIPVCCLWTRSSAAICISLLVICLASLSNADETRTRRISAAAVTPPNSHSPVAFRNIAKGYRSGFSEAAQTIVRTQAEWNALWRKHSSIETNPSQAPAVDFGKEIVVGVFLGQKPTGGYAVEIVSVERNDGTLTVSFREKVPPPGAILTQAFTQPFHIVRIGVEGTQAVRFRRTS